MELETARELAQEKVAHLKKVNDLARQEIEPGDERSCSEIFTSLGRRIEALPGFSPPTEIVHYGNAQVLFKGQSPEDPPFLALSLTTEYVTPEGLPNKLDGISARWVMLEAESVAYSGTGDDELIIEDVYADQVGKDNDSARQRLNLIAQSVTEAERATAAPA